MDKNIALITFHPNASFQFLLKHVIMDIWNQKKVPLTRVRKTVKIDALHQQWPLIYTALDHLQQLTKLKWLVTI